MSTALILIKGASRFVIAREEAAARASLQECGNALETGANALERARSMIHAAIGAEPEKRDSLRQQVRLSLNTSIAELRAVAEEMGA